LIVPADTMQRGAAHRPLDRLLAAFVLVVLGAATLVFWIGIPVGLLWFFSKVTDSWNRHFLMSLVLIPVAMALFAPVLFWLNGLYLRITGVLRPGGDDPERRWRLRGPLELFLYLGMAVAMVALFGWFFFLANNPPEVVW
jgi:ABC-type proline/glycine betaine transport system permease subunit